MLVVADRLEAGSPYPLGAILDGLNANLALFPIHAGAVDLCVFDPQGRRPPGAVLVAGRRPPLPDIAVGRLHATRIEVVPDVDYNCTCKGSELGPILCWEGFDNASYDRLNSENARHGLDHPGTGDVAELSNRSAVLAAASMTQNS